MEHLKSIFEGNDYDQTLDLFYDETLAFKGVADHLVKSVNGDLQIRLTFSGGHGFNHTLKLADKFVVLIPEVTDIDADVYLKLSEGFTLAWPLREVAGLWEKLRYDPEELKGIELATSNELFLVWLVSSGYSTVQSIAFSSMADAVSRNIIAEDPEGMPSVKEIIQGINKGKMFLKTVETFNSHSFITAYIDSVNGSTIDWKSMSTDRKHCLIGSDVAIKIIFS